VNKRIWELDVFRGICILGVVAVHAVYDLVELYHIIDWQYPAWFSLIKNWGGLLFVVLSGICVTLGSRSVRRGIIVLLCGMVITAVTYGMYHFEISGKGILIYFGVLHCLGTCMILWPVFKQCPWWILLLLGGIFIYFGFEVQGMRVDTKYLVPLGLTWEGFASSDYFPLLPNLGYFLAGAGLGRLIYPKKQSLMPKVKANKGLLGFFQKCGRNSLWIYLIHQPIISGICMLIMMLKK
jgi:uncharacterized membrane protein